MAGSRPIASRNPCLARIGTLLLYGQLLRRGQLPRPKVVPRQPARNGRAPPLATQFFSVKCRTCGAQRATAHGIRANSCGLAQPLPSGGTNREPACDRRPDIASGLATERSGTVRRRNLLTNLVAAAMLVALRPEHAPTIQTTSSRTSDAASCAGCACSLRGSITTTRARSTASIPTSPSRDADMSVITFRTSDRTSGAAAPRRSSRAAETST